MTKFTTMPKEAATAKSTRRGMSFTMMVANPNVVVNEVRRMASPAFSAMNVIAASFPSPRASARPYSEIMWMSSVAPMTTRSIGRISETGVRSRPRKPMNPTVTTTLIAPVMAGMITAVQLR